MRCCREATKETSESWREECKKEFVVLKYKKSSLVIKKEQTMVCVYTFLKFAN